MYTPYEDPIVKRKRDAQRILIKKAGGKISQYSQIAHEEVVKLRKKYPGKFQKTPIVMQ